MEIKNRKRVIKWLWAIVFAPVFMVLLALLLVAGMGFFVAEYVSEAENWVMFAGSPHVYNNTNLGCGTVVDRSGNVLLGEVSQCNDDNTDNRFRPPVGRFPKIEEDEAPYRLLCNEYPEAE